MICDMTVLSAALHTCLVSMSCPAVQVRLLLHPRLSSPENLNQRPVSPPAVRASLQTGQQSDEECY